MTEPVISVADLMDKLANAPDSVTNDVLHRYGLEEDGIRDQFLEMKEAIGSVLLELVLESNDPKMLFEGGAGVALGGFILGLEYASIHHDKQQVGL